MKKLTGFLIIVSIMICIMWLGLYNSSKDKEPKEIVDLRIDVNSVLITDYLDFEIAPEPFLSINSTEDTIFYNNNIYVKQ